MHLEVSGSRHRRPGSSHRLNDMTSIDAARAHEKRTAVHVAAGRFSDRQGRKIRWGASQPVRPPRRRETREQDLIFASMKRVVDVCGKTKWTPQAGRG